MAIKDYTYNIADDTLNGSVSVDKLSQEIKESAITIGEDSIEKLGNLLTVWMKDTLSSGDETILDGLIAAHDGIPLFEPELEKDSDGALLSRTKVTQTGWQYHMQGVEFQSSELNSIYNKDDAGVDLGYATIKLYDAQDEEITTQTSADINCVKTVVDWEPTFDYEVIGGSIKTDNILTSDIYVYVTAVPDIPSSLGGSKNFICCINMKYIRPGDEVKADGRSSKKLTYDATYHTNKMRIILKHDAGKKANFLMTFEMFKE